MLKSLKQTKRTLFQRPHFSSSALSDFAKTAFFEETRKMQEEATYKTLMENLQKVFFLEEKSKSSRDFLAQCFQRLSLNAKTPLKDILEHYQSKNRLGFDEELLALSLDYLARTMKSITPGRKATEDCSVEELHQNPRFVDMVEEVKYGLKEGVFFELKHIFKAVEALWILEYKDLDLHNMLFQKIQRSLRNQTEQFSINVEDPFQNPQSFKRFYYENILDLSSIFQNPNFLSKLNEFLSLEVVQEESQQIQEELDFRQNQDAISALLGNLKEMVGKSELNLKKIIQGIMGVRSQYRKMKGLKDNHELLKENPNVQIIFLELEEKLLNVGLINLEEINSNEIIIQDQNKELYLVTEIFQEFIQRNYPESSIFLPLINETNETKEQSLKSSISRTKLDVGNEMRKQEENSNGIEISGILLYISEISKLQVCESKGRDYVEKKWEKIFEKISMPSDVKDAMNSYGWKGRRLECDVLFTPVYLDSLKYFKSLYPEIIKTLPSQPSLKQLTYFSYAYANMGLSSKSSYFLSLINPTNAQELLSFNLKEYNLFLNNLLISFTQNSSIIPGLIDYISANWVSFDLEASTLSLLCISLYKLDEKAFNLLPNLLNQFYETLEGQQELETLRSTLTSHIFDVKMLLDSNNHFGFKGYDDKEKKFAGFQMIKPGFGDNNPEQNPVLNEFLLVLKRNLELERGITDINAFKSLKFNQFSRDYQPQLFTSLLEGSLYRAVFFLDTIQLDWEGNNLKEIWRLRFKTLETLEPTLKCDYISSNLVYQFGNDQKTVFLKPKSLLNGLINKILKGNDVFEPLKGLNGFSKVLMRFYNRNRKEIKGYKDRAILLKVVGELNEAGLMIKKANLASFKMLRGHYMEKSKLLLFLGYKAIHLLSKNLRKKLLKEINHVSPKGTQYTTIKSFYKSLILSLKSSETTETSSIKDILNENPWLGRRLSNELTAKTFNKEDATKDLDYEIIDLGFYNDKSYHQYKDWKQRLSSLTHNNLAFITPRLFSTCLFSSNQESKVSDVIGVIPEGNRLRDMIKPLSYRLMWEENLYQKSKGDNEKVKRYEGLAGVCQENIDKETRFIMNLQNFKYVLKKDFEVKEIGTLLNEFKFIDELIKEHLEGDLELNSKGFQKKVRRKGKDFIGYLNHPLRGAFINDYTRFMLKAALKKEDFNEMVKVRNSFRLYKEYKEGKIDFNTLVKFRERLDEKIMSEIEKMEQESSEYSTVTPQSRKFLDFEYDKEELLRNINSTITRKEQTLDFIKSKGKSYRFLQKEKHNAETKLIKLRILKKLHENQTISSNERLYLKAWKEGTLPKKSFAPTKRSMGSLQAFDRDLIEKNQFVSIEKCLEFPLSDFIMEFSLFFNDKFLEQVDWRLEGPMLKEDWGIDIGILLPNYQNNEGSFLLYRYENHLLNRAGEFEGEEQDLIVEMMRILRNHTKKEKKEMEELEKDMRRFVGLVNPFKNRYLLFTRCKNYMQNN